MLFGCRICSGSLTLCAAVSSELAESAASWGGTDKPSRRRDRYIKNARAYWRIVALATWTFPLLFARLGVRLIGKVSSRTDRHARRLIMKVWGRGALKILGVRLEVEGKPPSGQYYIVANHMSYLDIILFARHLGCVFVAMVEMNHWPVVGFVVRHMNTIFIDRFQWRDPMRVNAHILSAIGDKHSVMVFPESTTSYGRDVLPFRAALLEAPLATGVPVHYATLTYHATPHCPNPEFSVCWVDDTPFQVHALELLRQRRIHATITFGQEVISGEDRKRLAKNLEDAVRRQLPSLRVDTLGTRRH